MKPFIYNFLSLICIGISLGHTQGQSPIDVDELSGCENLSHQIDVLQLANENIKLRLELMEHHFERQQQHQDTLEEMMQMLHSSLVEQQTEHQNELKQLLGSMDGKDCKPDHTEFVSNSDASPDILREFEKVSKLQEDILTKLDTKCPSPPDNNNNSLNAVNVDKEGATDANDKCWGIYTNILGELSSNLTILQNIDSKLNKLNDQYVGGSEKHEKSIAAANGLLKLLQEKEDSKICVSSKDEKLLCTAETHPTSCADHDSTHCTDGKCRIKNLLYGSETFLVSCDDSTDGGGWTVIQRRINGTEDFYRGWSEYKSGFGNLDGEFWIGLDKLHALTTSLAPVELLIQLKDHNDTMKYARYGRFSIGSELEMYELKEADDYKGNAWNAFGRHKGFKFTTKDNDNDLNPNRNCAVDKRGAWWYRDCYFANLNGAYYKTGVVPKDEEEQGISWANFHDYNYSLKFVQMMIRPNKG